MQVRKQERAGISCFFEPYMCDANKATFLLGGNLEITCQKIPVTVQARMCLFEDFDKVNQAVEDNNEV